MKTLNKIVITHLDNEIISPSTVMISYEDNEVCDLNVYYDGNESLVGNIYLGYVKDIVKNINAAFVEFSDGVVGYLPLEDTPYTVFANKKNTDKLCLGDKIIVQVVKDKIKTKDYYLTTRFGISGRYTVLTCGDSRISISSKIKDAAFSEAAKEQFSRYITEGYGFILRTNSYNAKVSDIEDEIVSLKKTYENIVTFGVTRPGKTMLYSSENALLTGIRDRIKDNNISIVTDIPAIYEDILNMCKRYELNPELKLYNDDYELYKLYSINSLLTSAVSKRVWLKSGGYLIIEVTEALTVIDVNTGKYESKINKEEAFFKINKEAAKEIARQLRIRNISGIIIVDFINMSSEENYNELTSYMKQLLSRDYTKATVIDTTKLGLMEITRKKITEPFILKR